jgi:putative spermidine/putrescine transport system ATP-binding protein
MSLVEARAANAIPARVESLEYGGRDSLVTVVTDGHDVLHVRTSHRVEPGERVHVAAPVERVLVYTPDSDSN